jgi:hypothetical protein
MCSLLLVMLVLHLLAIYETPVAETVSFVRD